MKKSIKRQLVILIAAVMACACFPATGSAAEPEITQLVKATDAEGQIVSIEEVDEADYDGFICVLKDDAGSREIREVENQIDAIDDPQTAEEICGGEIFRADSLEVIDEIVEPSAVDYIEPNYLIRAQFSEDPSDHYNRTMRKTIAIEDVWDAGVLGAGQGSVKTPVVAVIDSGVVGFTNKGNRHEDLLYSHFPYALWSESFSSPNDTNGHGTFVIGQIMATMGNNKGVTGLMPMVKIVPVRVMGSDGTGSTAAAISALNTLIRRGNVDVVNMSFGVPYYSQTLADTCKKAAAKKMILVAAAGNEGSTRVWYPAGYDGVIGVAAVKGNGAKWKYSQYNDSVDAAAPGVSIRSLSLNNGYCTMSGTSFATPMVSALAAMVKSIDPSVNEKKFARILKKTSKDKGKPGYDTHYGVGVINFTKACQYVKKNKGKIRAATIRKSQKPRKGKITSLKATKTTVTVRSKKLSRTTSYQAAIKVKGGTYYRARFRSRSFKFTGLPRHTTLYIKVRGVRNINGVTVYGKWSKTRSFRTK